MSFTVPELKKRIVLLLAALALGGGMMVVCFGKSSPDRKKPEKTASDGAGAEDQKSEKADSALGDDSDFSHEFSYDPGKGMYSSIIRAVLFVAVLGAAAFYVSKKLLPKITNLPGKEVRVVETVYLGPRKAVHVLEVGSRRFLIGSTNENVTKLADITDITGNYVELSAKEVSYN